MTRRLLLWSNQEGAWWAAPGEGYTGVIECAGTYTEAEAAEVVATAGAGHVVRSSRITPGALGGPVAVAPDVAVYVEDADDQDDQRDPVAGFDRNGAWLAATASADVVVYARDVAALVEAVERWRSIAARVALADGAFYRLSTAERDELEAAMGEHRLGDQAPVTGAYRPGDPPPVGPLLSLDPDDVLPPLCLAFCCVEPLGHPGRHTEVHYVMFDAGQEPRSGAVCECHPTIGTTAPLGEVVRTHGVPNTTPPDVEHSGDTPDGN